MPGASFGMLDLDLGFFVLVREQKTCFLHIMRSLGPGRVYSSMRGASEPDARTPGSVTSVTSVTSVRLELEPPTTYVGGAADVWVRTQVPFGPGF